MGLTYLCKTIEDNKEDTKLRDRLTKKAHFLLINHFLTNGMKLNNYQVSLQEYLHLYQITSKEYHLIQREIIRRTTGIGDLTDTNQIKDGLMARLMEALFWALGDKHQVTSQLQLLLASQGDTYKPFISSEVNKLLKTNIDATKGLADIAKALIPNTGLTINNNNSSSTNNVTVERAVQLLEAEPTVFTLAQGGNLPHNLLDEATLGNLPEISAIHQNSEMSGQVTLNKKALKIRQSTHDTRREDLNDYEEVDIEG